jgi:arylsulfatase A-like enzyme
VYAAMVRNLDRNIGRVLKTLKDKGLDDNTIVIFTSDNGGAHYVGLDGLNSPYRGWKATFFEGGIRVPMFMRWPAGIPKGVKPQLPVNHMDIFTTVTGPWMALTCCPKSPSQQTKGQTVLCSGEPTHIG